MAADDDTAALAEMATELHGRYGRDYRVICTPAADEAGAELSRLADLGEEVALVLAAPSIGGTTGGELFDRARALHPHAKRGLVVPWRAWADQATAETIFDSMALGRIDYYVLKPSASPDEVFHQAVTSFLVEWTRARRLSPHTIHVVGEEWAGRAYELRETLHRCALPHAFCLADSEKGRSLLAGGGERVNLPAIVLPNGEILANPSNKEIAEAAGAPVALESDEFDALVIGAGPAGLSAAVYASSEGLRTLVVDEGGVGGQATSSSLIRNYLGFPHGVSGTRLSERAYEQAWVLGAEFLFMHRAEQLERDGERLAVTLSTGERIRARAVVLATGASYRRLGVPSLETLAGAGVFYGGAESEAHAMAGREAYVLGGANSAGQAALHLARFARRVTLVARGQSLAAGMSHYLVREIEATPKIEVRTATEVVGGGGDGHLEHLVLRQGDAEETVAADGLFVLIGARPHTDWLPDAIARDRHGFLLTGSHIPEERRISLERDPLSLETSMARVLAVGDVRHGSACRVASAVGEGSAAVQLLHSLFGSERPPSAAAKLAS